MTTYDDIYNGTSHRFGIGFTRADDATESDGTAYGNAWTEAAGAALYQRVHTAVPDTYHRVIPELAAEGRRWFTDMWRREQGRPLTHWPINTFKVEFYGEQGCQGPVLAEVDLLTGAYFVAARA